MLKSLTVEEEFRRAGYSFEKRAYNLEDGRAFYINRPIGLPETAVYTGRAVSEQELIAIWNHQARLVRGQVARQNSEMLVPA